MAALQPMGGVVTGFAQAMEEVGHLPFNLAVQLQAPDQGQLGFLKAREQTKTGGSLLRKPLAQLAQLDQGRIWIVGEVTLGQQPQPG